MFARWRGNTFPFLLFVQTSLAGFALHEGTSPTVWLICLGIATCVNALGWWLALRTTRAIFDTPTSRVASAAQGYVELHGRADAAEAISLLTPHSGLPCLWYRHRIERRENNKWQHVNSTESSAPFDLVDESGRCQLDPAGAHIQTTHQDTYRDGDLRHTEQVLLKGDPLYALGTFHSQRGTDLVLNARLDVGHLLEQWKTDQAALLQRFDLDQDGDISDQEWALARQAARREIDRQHAMLRNQPTRHTLHTPDDRRPYLISNLPPDKLGRRYVLWTRLFLGLLLGSLALATWALKTTAP